MTPPSTPTSPLLEVRNLTIGFGQMSVVRDVSFDLQAGEILGIVGESGSGKSMTCRALMGLLPGAAQSTGSIRFKGHELLAADDSQWRSIRGRDMAMIFQNPASHLDPLRRVGQQVAAPMVRHLGIDGREALGRAIRLLDEVGIHDAPERARSYPHQFSGGMKQRAMIAAAIACGPKLLLADEPTTALDVTVQARILRLLKDLNGNRGLAMIFVSHDLGVIADICSQVVVMREGEVVERGAVREIIDRPQHAYTRQLINSQPARRSFSVSPKEKAGAALLKVEGLSVSFPSRKALGFRRSEDFIALQDIDLEIGAGETVGIVGESGSGKSTLARAVTLQNQPNAGAIFLDGKNVDTFGRREVAAFRRRVQMVFQNPYGSLNPRMTAAEAVAEPIWRHGLADRRSAKIQAEELLEMVELPTGLGNRKPHQLSGGQCQRIGLARALALKPELLIADEITSALDVTTQAQILDLLIRLQKERSLALLYISHDLHVVGSLCQRVYVFKGGRVVESGPARQVLGSPRAAYTQELVGSLTQFATPVPAQSFEGAHNAS